MFRAPPPDEDRPGDGGIDDLVAGVSQSDDAEAQARSTRAIRRQ
jgi:hypothetical protein